MVPASPDAPARIRRAPARREALRALLLADGLDAVLVTEPAGVRYLSGFTGSNGAVLVDVDGDDESFLATDGRYVLQAGAETPDLPLVVARAAAQGLLTDLQTATRVGFDSAHVTVDALRALQEAAPHLELVRAPGLVERLRAVKDDGEVEALRRACELTDAAFAGLLADGGLRAGRSERAVARELEDRMIDLGGDGPAFETIVAAGVRGALPHHRPGDATLAAGDLVTMDFGARVDGYHADMTRTVGVRAVATWQRDLHALVAAAAAAGRAACRPGVAATDVDAAARAVIAEAGHGEQFVHPVGHGVGLAIHEAPALSSRADVTLEAGMVVTVEPGVYLAGRGGVRIEDTLVVTAGGAEALTTTTRELLVTED